MYEIIELRGTTEDTLISEVASLWTKGKIFSEATAHRNVKNAALGIKHTPTGRLISVSTARIKFTRPLNGYYYHYGVFSLPGHGSRPLLLPRTYDYMRSCRENSIRGMAILVKNPRITVEVLERFGFRFPEPGSMAPFNLVYRNFI